MEEDFFAFRHGEYPAMGIFRSRTTANTRDEDGDGAGGSKPKGRGRRMATFGVVFGKSTILLCPYVHSEMCDIKV